jgi:hypothetical protein
VTAETGARKWAGRGGRAGGRKAGHGGPTSAQRCSQPAYLTFFFPLYRPEPWRSAPKPGEQELLQQQPPPQQQQPESEADRAASWRKPSPKVKPVRRGDGVSHLHASCACNGGARGCAAMS